MFNSNRKGLLDIDTKAANSRAEERPILEGSQPKSVDDWPAGGRFLCYEQVAISELTPSQKILRPLTLMQNWSTPLEHR